VPALLSGASLLSVPGSWFLSFNAGINFKPIMLSEALGTSSPTIEIANCKVG